MGETATIRAAITMQLTRTGRPHVRRPQQTLRQPRALSSPDALTIIDRTTQCIALRADRNRRAERSPSPAAFRARFVRSAKPARADDERVEAQVIRRRPP